MHFICAAASFTRGGGIQSACMKSQLIASSSLAAYVSCLLNTPVKSTRSSTQMSLLQLCRNPRVSHDPLAVAPVPTSNLGLCSAVGTTPHQDWSLETASSRDRTKVSRRRAPLASVHRLSRRRSGCSLYGRSVCSRRVAMYNTATDKAAML